MTRSALAWIALLTLGGATLGCQGTIFDGPARPDGPGPGGPPPPPEDLSECRMPTYAIYAGLHARCVGCHGPQDNRPLFASLEAFERQVAYRAADPSTGQPIYVRPGDPDGSELVALLEGTSDNLGQMPPGDRSYAQIVADGGDGVSVAEVRRWIEDLEICELPAPPPRPIARRLPAELIRDELMRQLALTDADVEQTGRPLGSPDDSPQRVSTDQRGAAHEAWADLGGGHILAGERTSTEISEPMLLTLVPLSQAWCARSVETRDVLFRHATRDSASATERPAIRDNIRYLYLHMLGEVASDADVDAMLETVFLPTEADAGPRAAWTAVCAAFVRDPLWLSY